MARDLILKRTAVEFKAASYIIYGRNRESSTSTASQDIFLKIQKDF